MKKEQFVDFGMLGVLALIWGSSFILIKKGLIAFTPIQVGSLRVIVAGVFLFFIGFRNITKFSKKDVPVLLGVGLVGSGIPAILFALAQTKVASATTGALNSLTPLFTFLVGLLFFKTAFRANKIGGVLLGLVGALFLVLNGNNLGELGNFNSYILFIVVATVCYATSVNLVKNYLQNVPPITISLCSFLFIFPVFIPLILSTGIVDTFTNATNQTWYAFGAIAILAILGTALANILFFRLTQRSSALFASSVTYLIPIVATAWGFADGETIGFYHFLGLLFTISGVYLVGRK